MRIIGKDEYNGKYEGWTELKANDLLLLLKGENKSSEFNSIWNSFLVNTLNFHKLVIPDRVNLNEHISVNHRMSFRQVVFKEKVSFQNIQFNETITFDGVEIEDDLLISNCKLNASLGIKSGYFKEVSFHLCELYHFTIEGGIFKNIDFNNNILQKAITICNCKIISALEIISFYGNSTNRIIVGGKGDTYINSIEIQENDNSHITVVSGNYNTLKVHNGLALSKSVFRAYHTHFNEILFENFHNVGTVLFDTIHPRGKCLSIADDGTIGWVDKDSRIILHHSNLGKTEVINSGLSMFKHFYFESSNLLQLFLANSDMPSDLKVSEYLVKGLNSLQKKTAIERQKALYFSQLKEVYAKQGDKVEAAKYYALEMEAYRASLPQGWTNEWQEKLILGLNRWSNYYGTSILHALGFTLLISLTFFQIYFLYLNSFAAQIDLPSIGEMFGYWVEFISPIHRFDFMKEHYTKIGAAKAIDFIARLFISYGIYQFIQAFRKHGRR